MTWAASSVDVHLPERATEASMTLHLIFMTADAFASSFYTGLHQQQTHPRNRTSRDTEQKKCKLHKRVTIAANLALTRHFECGFHLLNGSNEAKQGVSHNVPSYSACRKAGVIVNCRATPIVNIRNRRNSELFANLVARLDN